MSHDHDTSELDIESIFAEIDQRLKDVQQQLPDKITSAFTDDELATSEIPFELFANGSHGKVDILPNEYSNSRLQSISSGVFPLPNAFPDPVDYVVDEFLNLERDGRTGLEDLDQLLDWYVPGSDDYYKVDLSEPTSTLELCHYDMSYGENDDEKECGSFPECSGNGGEMRYRYKDVEFVEVPVEDSEKTAANSGSLKRAPGPRSEFAKGSVNNVPFRPGGMEEEVGEENTPKVGSSALSPPTVLPFDTVELDELITTMPGLSAGLEGLRMDGGCEGEQLLLSDECDVAPPYVMGSNESALAAASEEMTPEDIVGRQQMLYQQRINNEAERERREQMLTPAGAPQSESGARGGAASLSAVFGDDSESESEAAPGLIGAPREEVKATEPDPEADPPNDSRFITRDLLEEADDESDVSADELAEILEPST
eukprot:997825_1